MQIYQGKFQFTWFSSFADSDYCLGWEMEFLHIFYWLFICLEPTWHEVWVTADHNCLCTAPLYDGFQYKIEDLLWFHFKTCLIKSITYLGTGFKNGRREIYVSKVTLARFAASFQMGLSLLCGRIINTFSYLFILIYIRAPSKHWDA